MKPMIFINLPVKDLKKAMNFYGNIGFTNNPQFTDHTAACMVLSDEIYVMVLTHEKFKSFTPKQISDATQTTEVLNSLALGSREEVNSMCDRAIKAGAGEVSPVMDQGFMFQRNFSDPDGHIWEVLWMDPSFVKKNQ